MASDIGFPINGYMVPLLLPLLVPWNSVVFIDTGALFLVVLV